MVTAVAMDSRVQKLPRVHGGSYTSLSEYFHCKETAILS